MSDDLERVRAAALAEQRKPPVAGPWPADATRLVAIDVGLAAAVVAGWSQYQHGSLSPRRATAGLLLALIGAASVAAVRPGGRRGQLAALGLAVASAATLLTAEAGRRSGLPLFADAECALVELAVSLLPAVATVGVLRRFSYQPRRALLGGLAAGASGVLVLDVACAVGGALHVLAFHLAPCALVAGALVVARSKLTSRTFAP